MRWTVLASLWAVIFAAVHLAWACGWYVGLDPVAATTAFARPWFLAYDVIAALGCFIAASAFGVLASNHGGRLRSAARVFSVVAAVVVALRAVTGLGAVAWRGLGLAGVFASGWDQWFVLGAVLFAAALRTRPRSLRVARTIVHAGTAPASNVDLRLAGTTDIMDWRTRIHSVSEEFGYFSAPCPTDRSSIASNSSSGRQGRWVAVAAQGTHAELQRIDGSHRPVG